MGFRRDVRKVVDNIKEMSRRDPEIFMITGRHFVGGLLKQYDQHLPVKGCVDEARYRTREFGEGLRSVKASLGYSGDNARSNAPKAGISYISELRESMPSIWTSSIIYYANIFLRDGHAFYYDGMPAKGFAGIGRLLVSDSFIRRLDQGHTADVFFKCIAEQCDDQKAIP